MNNQVENICYVDMEIKGLAQQSGKWTFSSEVIHHTLLQIYMTKPHIW